jgi:type III secretion protein J
MPIRVLILLLSCLILGACGERVALHSHLSEQDANDVIAELADKRIQASKQLEKDGVTVLVDPSDMNSAVRALEAAGLPRRSRSSLGDIFRKEGVISTPMEERARYIYALSQELESTLSQIDGVVVARVHVVLPERIAPGEPVQPASASVFIKHTNNLDPDGTMPRVRNLVASGIPGMADKAGNSEKLSVVFVPSAPYREQRQMAYLGPFLMSADDVGYWKTVFWVSALVLILLLAGGIYLLRAQLQAAASRLSPGTSADQSSIATTKPNNVVPGPGPASKRTAPTNPGNVA